jgi:RNA polymerase sigma factor (sigma-70 family)
MNEMTNDAQLLDRYVLEHSETAFAELVERHVGIVYHAALRQIQGHSEHAKDISQLVFVLLAQKAPSLRSHPCLAGWLLVTTHKKVRDAVRTERRRLHREYEAFMTQDKPSDSISDHDWGQIRTSLDAALLKLKQCDRDALILRFFEGVTLRDIAHRFALSEDATQKRISRALEKLRRVLSRRGFTSTSSALAAMLTGHVALAAPDGLAATISATVMASKAIGVATIAPATKAFIHSFMGIKTKATIVIAIASGIGLFTYQVSRRQELQRALQALKADNRILASQEQQDFAAKERATAALSATRTKIDDLLSQLKGGNAGITRASVGTEHRLAAGMKHIGEAANLGGGTPIPAAESLFWAFNRREPGALGPMMIMDEATKKSAEDLYNSLPSDARSQLQTPEEMMTDWLAASFPKDVVGYQLAPVSGALDSDRVDIPTIVQLANGSTVVSGFNLQKVDGNWMLTLNPGYVQSLESNLGAVIHP